MEAPWSLQAAEDDLLDERLPQLIRDDAGYSKLRMEALALFAPHALRTLVDAQRDGASRSSLPIFAKCWSFKGRSSS